MRSDIIIRKEGYEAIFEKLGIVEAEKFITLLKREKFDYTEWRKNLWEDKSVEELSDKASQYYKNK